MPTSLGSCVVMCCHKISDENMWKVKVKYILYCTLLYCTAGGISYFSAIDVIVICFQKCIL